MCVCVYVCVVMGLVHELNKMMMMLMMMMMMIASFSATEVFWHSGALQIGLLLLLLLLHWSR